MNKKDFTIGSLWKRSINGLDEHYFLVIKCRQLDVQFAGYRFLHPVPIGNYYFNWTEILSGSPRVIWEKVS